MRVLADVASALAANRPVVALESTIISHGLPRPRNLQFAREIEQAVRSGGAVRATVAIVDGAACIGLDDEALAVIASSTEVMKMSVRDLGTVAARGGTGGTTVAATAHLAARAGISEFATGGLGGVHRGFGRPQRKPPNPRTDGSTAAAHAQPGPARSHQPC